MTGHKEPSFAGAIGYKGIMITLPRATASPWPHPNFSTPAITLSELLAFKIAVVEADLRHDPFARHYHLVIVSLNHLVIVSLTVSEDRFFHRSARSLTLRLITIFEAVNP
jgi:hypothetical protein